MKIHNFKYVAKDSQGKIVKGKIEAVNRHVCLKYLESRSYQIERLIEYKRIIPDLSQITLGRILNPKQLIFFLNQLGALLDAGVKILESLEMLMLQQENKAHKKIYFELYQQVYSGLSLSHAMSNRPKEFPKLLINMIEVGEISGKLPSVILEMAKHYEKQMKLTTDIKNAIRMPVIYLFATVLIAVGMLLFVFPNISALYASFEGATLPPITQFFLDVSDFLGDYALAIFMSFLGVVSIVVLLNKFFQKINYGLNIILLKMPIIGKLVQMNNQILITNTLAQMLGSEIQSLEALQIVKSVLKNVIYKDLITTTIRYIEDGLPFSKSFQESSFVDPILAKMIAAGEKTGDLADLMKNMAVYYNNISEMRVARLKDSIQPILLILVYSIVGLLILALMLPMLSLGGQI